MTFTLPNELEDQIKSKDDKVIFDEKQHIYYYEGKPLISVTQFIKQFTKPFNSIYASNGKAKKNAEERLGITNPRDLRRYWRLGAERSTHNGTATHAFAEMYILDRKTRARTGYEKAVVKAINRLEEKWDIVEQEEIVYSWEYMIAGTMDLLLKNKKTGEYAIGDWKTTEDLLKSYGKLLQPFESFTDSALNKYSIQLDIYTALAPYYIPEVNRIIIKVDEDGEFTFYTPNNKKEEYKLPFTQDKTKLALENYKKQNKL